MQLGMIGLGRMGANMVRRLMQGGPPVRRLRQSARSRRRTGQGEGARARRRSQDFVDEARQAARDLADGAGGGRRRNASPTWRRCSSAATS